MQSRQDQLRSHQFTVQRVVAALVTRRTDPVRAPLGPMAGATGVGVLVAILALAAVAGYGVLVDGGRADAGTQWRDGGVVIVERGTGARYVYREGRLHPVLNYASALLIIGSGQRRAVHVSARSIEGVPRGVPLGIPGAPDSLPEPTRLVGTPWTLCSHLVDSGGGPVGSGSGRVGSGGRPGGRTGSVLFIGAQPDGAGPDGGRSMGDAGLLVRDPAGAVFLLWRSRRHLVREPSVVLSALGWDARPVTPVAAALVNALPAGADLARIPIAGRGGWSPRLPGARVGEVFVVESLSGGRQFAVALSRGLAALTQVQADILLGDPLTARLLGQTQPRRLDQGTYATLPKVGEVWPRGDLAPPAATPNLTAVTAAGGVCAEVQDGTGGPDLRVDVRVPAAEETAVPAKETAVPAKALASRAGGGAVRADRVLVAPGRGVVVAALASPLAPAGALSLVTDLGVRHDVPRHDVLAMLGYAAVRPVRLPAGLVALLPVGPALDPAAARSPAAW
ncbi:MAG TPA: type VII secretion protein EccB [Micromonosporaceae bacterium]|nr:type VII secretion protein EccB [Micromonosporaceae bacterium]